MLLYFFSYPWQVQSLKCFECQSSTSLEECTSQETQVTCPSYLNNCAYIAAKFESGGVSSQAYTKGTFLYL